VARGFASHEAARHAVGELGTPAELAAAFEPVIALRQVRSLGDRLLRTYATFTFLGFTAFLYVPSARLVRLDPGPLPGLWLSQWSGALAFAAIVGLVTFSRLEWPWQRPGWRRRLVWAGCMLGWGEAVAAAVWGAIFCERAAVALGEPYLPLAWVVGAATVAGLAALLMIHPRPLEHH
jgi:hypothetical protein